MNRKSNAILASISDRLSDLYLTLKATGESSEFDRGVIHGMMLMAMKSGKATKRDIEQIITIEQERVFGAKGVPASRGQWLDTILEEARTSGSGSHVDIPTFIRNGAHNIGTQPSR
ncbi:hypothetical protein [Magnetofaba australis]|uniref:hypothetical protein n=1 Tax=Magnetofaba australis TaxID=1472297 RepID=UPI000A19D46C|nr:hypothetical protein [Magnetofaba australis]